MDGPPKYSEAIMADNHIEANRPANYSAPQSTGWIGSSILLFIIIIILILCLTLIAALYLVRCLFKIYVIEVMLTG